MSTIIIHDKTAVSVMQVWYPKYSEKYKATGEWVALLAKYKVDDAMPIIVVEFTKAKHLIGHRFAIKRSDAMKCNVDSNGSIACYSVPMSALQHYDYVEEVLKTVNEVFPDAE